MDEQKCHGCGGQLGREAVKAWDNSKPSRQYTYFCSKKCAEEHGIREGFWLVEALTPRQ
jgi:hypothetical protein